MAFTTPGESRLRYCHESRKAGHGHEDVAVIKERAPQPGRAIHLRAVLCGGNCEPDGERWRARKAADLTLRRSAPLAGILLTSW
jgi:hypothetical protein